MPLKELRGIFPNMSANSSTITSQINLDYNCVAWALGDTQRWWEPYGVIVPAPYPHYHWPQDVPHDTTPQTYVRLFETYGFVITENSDFEDGYEKLAIYVFDEQFRHVARQLRNGSWTSKIGQQEDIQHEIVDLESNSNKYHYGEVSLYMKRKLT